MNKTGQILGTIAAMQTLVENFPMGIFDALGNKVYSNPIDFLLDVLKQVGVDDRQIINLIIETVFGVSDAVNLYNGYSKFTYKRAKLTDGEIAKAVKYDYVPNSEEITVNYPDYIYVEKKQKTYYVKKQILKNGSVQSKFFVSLEHGVKEAIRLILKAMLSVSITLQIPDNLLDYSNSATTRQTMLIPVSSIDFCHILDYCPSSNIGENIYDMPESLNANDLYKAIDLDAFIWYVINRGSKSTQSEINKMMWDSRIEANINNFDNREDSSQWNYWLSSKTASTINNEFGLLYPSGYTEDEYTDYFVNGKMFEKAPIYPILQFLGTQKYSGEKCLVVSFPYQTFYNAPKESKKIKLNKTLNDFNKCYLNNIKIFNPNRIIIEMVDSLLNGNIFKNFNYSIETQVFDAKLNSIIKKAIENEDLNVSDCFYEFSNDEFNEALKKTELEKYSAKELNSETSPAIKIDENFGIDKINEINSKATMNEKIVAINKTVYDISAIPTTDVSVYQSDKLSVSYDGKWYTEVITAICRPIIKSILTPKVMLLMLINLNSLGIIDFGIEIDDVGSVIDNAPDILKDIPSALKELLLNELLKIITIIVKMVVGRVSNILFMLIEKYIKPLLFAYCYKILLEKLDSWIALLEEAIACIPLFDFNRQRYLTEIDDVNYADIETTQTQPNGINNC